MASHDGTGADLPSAAGWSGGRRPLQPRGRHNGLVFIAGQLPIEPGTGRKLSGEPIEAQTRRALANLDAALRAAGSRRDLVLKTTVFVTDIAHTQDIIYNIQQMSRRPGSFYISRRLPPC